MRIRNLSILIILISLGMVSCKKEYLERVPSDEVPIEDAFKDVNGLRAAINGIHRTMYEDVDHDLFGQKSIDLMADLMGDDMPISAQGAGWFLGAYRFQDHRTGGGTAGYVWTFYYRIISNANQILAHIDSAEGSAEEKNQIKAQALTYRAFAYFNLVQCYQFNYKMIDPNTAKGVPIYLEPTRDGQPRASVQQVYDRIEQDLKDAITIFGDGGPRPDKSQLDGSVTKGIYARVALAKQDWAKAADMAREARANYGYMTTTALLDGFNSINNPEWIWGSTLNVDQTVNTGSFLSHMVYESGGYASLGQQKLMNRVLLTTMPATDVRKAWWWDRSEVSGTVYRPYSQRKFKVKLPGTFITDVSYMRSAEMALIEAEALAQAHSTAAAATVLNDLMVNRNPDYVAPTERIALIKEILNQRRIELWGEGFRYFDIMRQMAYPAGILSEGEVGLHRGPQFTASVAVTIDVAPGANIFLFRIPGSEIENNANMTDADQNP